MYTVAVERRGTDSRNRAPELKKQEKSSCCFEKCIDHEPTSDNRNLSYKKHISGCNSYIDHEGS